MHERKITDLVSRALKEEDYKFRINFLLAGLMSAEGNDTPEKEENNRIFFSGYTGLLDGVHGRRG